MSEIGGHEYIERDSPVFSWRNLVRGIRNYRNGWRRDRLSFYPPYENGLYGPAGPPPQKNTEGIVDALAVITRIQLNHARKRPLLEGIDPEKAERVLGKQKKDSSN